MKKSEKLALISLSIGVAAGFALAHYFFFLPTWCFWLGGALVAGAVHGGLLQGVANESIIDSKTINKE